jgi:hypothetical protein
MTEMSAYPAALDPGRLAERVALDYVGEKIGASLGTVVRPQQSATYVTGPGSISSFGASGLGASVYRTAPTDPIMVMPQKHGLFRTIFQRKQAEPAAPIGAMTAIQTPPRLPITIYNEALASQAKVFRSYEPARMRLVMPIWAPKQERSTEIRELWRAIVEKFFEMRVQERAAEEAVQGRWVDEGLSHPPLQNMQTVRVRLNLIGPLPPRIAYDPDRE